MARHPQGQQVARRLRQPGPGGRGHRRRSSTSTPRRRRSPAASAACTTSAPTSARRTSRATRCGSSATAPPTSRGSRTTSGRWRSTSASASSPRPRRTRSWPTSSSSPTSTRRWPTPRASTSPTTTWQPFEVVLDDVTFDPEQPRRGGRPHMSPTERGDRRRDAKPRRRKTTGPAIGRRDGRPTGGAAVVEGAVAGGSARILDGSLIRPASASSASQLLVAIWQLGSSQGGEPADAVGDVHEAAGPAERARSTTGARTTRASGCGMLASLQRVFTGFGLAVAVGVPARPAHRREQAGLADVQPGHPAPAAGVARSPGSPSGSSCSPTAAGPRSG